MSNMSEELAKLGKEIESAKKSIATLEGRKAEVMERLKTDYNVNTVSEAEQFLINVQEKIKKLGLEIEEDYKQLKDKFTW